MHSRYLCLFSISGYIVIVSIKDIALHLAVEPRLHGYKFADVVHDYYCRRRGKSVPRAQRVAERRRHRRCAHSQTSGFTFLPGPDAQLFAKLNKKA